MPRRKRAGRPEDSMPNSVTTGRDRHGQPLNLLTHVNTCGFPLPGGRSPVDGCQQTGRDLAWRRFTHQRPGSPPAAGRSAPRATGRGKGRSPYKWVYRHVRNHAQITLSQRCRSAVAGIREPGGDTRRRFAGEGEDNGSFTTVSAAWKRLRGSHRINRSGRQRRFGPGRRGGADRRWRGPRGPPVAGPHDTGVVPARPLCERAVRTDGGRGSGCGEQDARAEAGLCRRARGPAIGGLRKPGRCGGHGIPARHRARSRARWLRDFSTCGPNPMR